MNSKGQAAITDALFLLLVVGVLSASLFAFLIQYGSTIQKYISSQYIIDFETTALKTTLYSSVPRDLGSDVTLANSKQVDYLLAVVKEDYLDDEKLSEPTMNILRNAIKISMKPLTGSFDYLFFIHATNGFVFVYLNSSTPSNSSSRIEYYCTAKNLLNVQRFLEDIGAFSPVASGITLSKARPGTVNLDTGSGTAELAMWVGTNLEKTDGSGSWLVNSMYDLEKIGASNTLLQDVSFDPTKPETPWCNAKNGCSGILVCKRIPPSTS